jgi:predicted Zn-dependent protease
MLQSSIVRTEIGSDGNPNFIQVRHGRMLINVPRTLFKGKRADFVKTEADRFGKELRSRYPWLSENAVIVILREARQTMLSLIEMESGPVDIARTAFEDGRPTQALQILDKHLQLHADDSDAWHLRGVILMRLGNAEEGFKSLARSRSANNSRSNGPIAP